MAYSFNNLIMEFVEKHFTSKEALIFKFYYIHNMTSSKSVAKLINIDEEEITPTIQKINKDIRSRLNIEIKEEEEFDPNPHNEDFTIEDNNNHE